jgi:hypothetical protein
MLLFYEGRTMITWILIVIPPLVQETFLNGVNIKMIVSSTIPMRIALLEQTFDMFHWNAIEV